MATKTATPKIGLRAGTTRTLRFGMVNVGLSMAPATDASARVSAKLLDPETLTPVRQQYVNANGEVVKPVKGYAYGDGFLTLDEGEVEKLDADGVIDLVANVATVPGEWVEKTALAWPTDTTQDQGYALVAHYLRESGRVFVGTQVTSGTTKVLALRWSDVYGCVIAQTLTFAACVRWGNIDIVKAGVDAIPAVDPAMAKMADTVFGSMADTFDWDDVTDEYGERLEAAIAEKGATGAVTAPAAIASHTPATDLMAALAASMAS